MAPKRYPKHLTSYVMAVAPEFKLDNIWDSYDFRTEIEKGLKQSTDALIWANFQVMYQE